MTVSNELMQRFGDAITVGNEIDPFVIVEPKRLVEVASFLRDHESTQFVVLNNISGVDYLEIDVKKLPKAGFEPHLEIVYHLSSFSDPIRRFTFKVLLSRWRNNVEGQLSSVPSLSSVWKTADWQEREVFDLFGITFDGHPDLRRILLADDWVGYPLRKDYDFPLEYHGIRCR